MDPLSILASTITLIQAANTVTTSLGSLARSLRTADSRISGLCDELSTLKGYLEAINDTLQDCRQQAPDTVTDKLWEQSELALINCQTTLNELGVFIDRTTSSSSPSQTKTFLWKARAVIDLNKFGADITTCREKLHHSNSALRTILNAIHLYISLNNKASIASILKKLEKLNYSIEEALHTASRPIGGFHNSTGQKSDSRITRNLQQLAEAAKSFHKSTASRASTVHSDAGDATPYIQAFADLSIFGDFPTTRRERVETYIFEDGAVGSESMMNEPAIAELGATKSAESINQTPYSACEGTDKDVEVEDDDVDWDRMIREGYKGVAIASIKVMDYDKATQALQKALTYGHHTSETGDERRDMQLQLALCYFFQGNWRLAEPLVKALAGTKTNNDLRVCNLLHALSLCYLSIFSLDEALSTCKQASQGKWRLSKDQDIGLTEYWETRSLLAVIADVADNCLLAEAIRQRLPNDFKYSHPPSAIAFVQSYPGLVRSIFGDATPDQPFLPLGGSFAVAELDGKTDYLRKRNNRSKVCPHGDMRNEYLRTKFLEFEKRELDTAKEVSFAIHQTSDLGDDDPFTSRASNEKPLRKRLTQLSA